MACADLNLTSRAVVSYFGRDASKHGVPSSICAVTLERSRPPRRWSSDSSPTNPLEGRRSTDFLWAWCVMRIRPSPFGSPGRIALSLLRRPQLSPPCVVACWISPIQPYAGALRTWRWVSCSHVTSSTRAARPSRERAALALRRAGADPRIYWFAWQRGRPAHRAAHGHDRIRQVVEHGTPPSGGYPALELIRLRETHKQSGTRGESRSAPISRPSTRCLRSQPARGFRRSSERSVMLPKHPKRCTISRPHRGRGRA
jgi:hypothetical protein